MFWTLQEARQYAQEAADGFHVPYAVFSVHDGRLRLLARFAGTPRCA